MADRKKPLREVVVTVEPFKWEASIVYGGDRAQVDAYVKDVGIETDPVDAGSLGHTWVYAGSPGVVWVYDITDIPVLVHELMHLVSGVLEARGLKFSRDSEETYTYSVENLLRRVLHAKKWRRV